MTEKIRTTVVVTAPLLHELIVWVQEHPGAALLIQGREHAQAPERALTNALHPPTGEMPAATDALNDAEAIRRPRVPQKRAAATPATPPSEVLLPRMKGGIRFNGTENARYIKHRLVPVLLRLLSGTADPNVPPVRRAQLRDDPEIRALLRRQGQGRRASREHMEAAITALKRHKLLVVEPAERTANRAPPRNMRITQEGLDVYTNKNSYAYEYLRIGFHHV